MKHFVQRHGQLSQFSVACSHKTIRQAAKHKTWNFRCVKLLLQYLSFYGCCILYKKNIALLQKPTIWFGIFPFRPIKYRNNHDSPFMKKMHEIFVNYTILKQLQHFVNKPTLLKLRIIYNKRVFEDRSKKQKICRFFLFTLYFQGLGS